MERLRAIILAVVLVLLSSCGGSVKDVELTSFRLVSVAPQGLSGITALIEAGIRNPGIGFEVTALHATIRMDGAEALYLDADQLMVEGHSDRTYDIPLKGSIAEGFNPFQLLRLLGSEADLSRLTVSVKARLALRGGIGKTVEINDVPLEELKDRI